jgi:hypothetical protein
MIYVILVIPVDDEITLLGRENGTTPESRVNIQGSRFRTSRSIQDDRPYVIESPPVASEVVDIDLRVDWSEGWVISRKREILNNPSFCRAERLRDSTQGWWTKRTNKKLQPRTREGARVPSKWQLSVYMWQYVVRK